MIKKIIPMLSLLLMFSCNIISTKAPDAIGKPYEMLVVCNNEIWNSSVGTTLKEILTQEIPGLPQPEPQFAVKQMTPAKFNESYKKNRAIIIIDINAQRYTKARYTYVGDEYLFASPQAILKFYSPNVDDLAAFINENSQNILDFFLEKELQWEYRKLTRSSNTIYNKMVKDMFGCEMLLPTGLTNHKAGKDFIWFTTGDHEINMAVYSYPFVDKNTFTKEYFVHKRDSIMKKNIIGSTMVYEELDENGDIIDVEYQAYMKTNGRYTDAINTSFDGFFMQEVRGLWEMEHDMMGGPFVSHVFADEVNNKIIVVEAFAYAPSKQKRNIIRPLEASLYSLRIPAMLQIKNSITPEIVITDEKIGEESDTIK